MNRFSVIYRLGVQYQHLDCSTLSEAKVLLERLLLDESQTPIGIYDAKTELFEWEPTRQQYYGRACIETQGRLGEQIISLAQSLRHVNAMEAELDRNLLSANSFERRV